MHSLSSGQEKYYPFYQIFLYCSCQYTKIGFMSLLGDASLQIQVIPVESVEDVEMLPHKSKKQLLVICSHDDSLYFSARSIWFEWCWKQNVLTNNIMCIRMFSEGNFSRENGYYDFSLCDSNEQTKKHIVKLLGKSFPPGRYVNYMTPLTPREKEVMKFISEGLSLREISERMSVSERNVSLFRMSIIKKMGFRNRNHINILSLDGEGEFQFSGFQRRQE
ncbi:two component system sensor kinase SsrB [Citrobacter freundii]|nr:two component system sensor kinase SsrB [Citrobacter freundii]